MNNVDDFFRKIIEKNSLAVDNHYSKADFLNDICTYFDVSHGFIYEIASGGVFTKNHFYRASYAQKLESTIDLKSILGTQLLSELSSEKIIVSCSDHEKPPLEKKLNEIFLSNTLIFIPILNQHYELSAFIGISDRRNKIRKGNINIRDACSVLTMLSNRVKLEMYQKSSQNAELILHNVLDNVNIDIYANDYYTHDMLYVNKSMAAPYGGVKNMMGKKCWNAIFTDKDGQCEFCPQPKLLDEDDKPTKAYTWDYERKLDGNWFRVFSSCIPWTDGRLAHLVASVDITESKKNQLLIERLAQYDHLTGLPNRRSLEDQLSVFIHDSALFTDKFYVLFCDLDGFKKVNDTLGHDFGDELLKAISKELKKFPSNTLRAYRHGGDEFVILLKNIASKDFVQEMLDKLFDVFTKTYYFSEKEMKCGCSIGVSSYPFDAITPNDLFRLADSAMYSAKKSGKGTVRFSSDNNHLTFDEYFSISK